MKKRNLMSSMLAGGIALATTSLNAQNNTYNNSADSVNQQPKKDQTTAGQYDSKYKDHERDSQTGDRFGNHNDTDMAGPSLKASTLIGMSVRDESGERLGRVQNLIVNLESHSAPFAIINYGGALGIGGKRVAVPLSDLKWSSDPKQLTIAATKEQFDAASSEPTGGWVSVAGADWMKHIDRFYGQPPSVDASRYERQENTGRFEGREPVRHQNDSVPSAIPAPNQKLTGPADYSTRAGGDQELTTKVNDIVRQQAGDNAGDVKVSIKGGVVTLSGKVGTEAQKQALQSQIKSLPGVDRVEDSDVRTRE